MKMMDNDTGPVPRRYSDAGSVERLVGVRASRYASGRPSLRRAGESGAGGLPPRQSHLNLRVVGYWCCPFVNLKINPPIKNIQL